LRNGNKDWNIIALGNELTMVCARIVSPPLPQQERLALHLHPVCVGVVVVVGVVLLVLVIDVESDGG
jgi:hypothetical protein